MVVAAEGWDGAGVRGGLLYVWAAQVDGAGDHQLRGGRTCRERGCCGVQERGGTCMGWERGARDQGVFVMCVLLLTV